MMGKFIGYLVVFLFGMYTGIFAIYNNEYLSQGAAKIFGANIARPLYINSANHRNPQENQRSFLARNYPNPSTPDDKKLGIYTVQVASFPDVKRAKELVTELSFKKFDAYVAPDDLENSRGWYRVYVGKYFEKVDARMEWRDLRKEFQDSFVRKF